MYVTQYGITLPADYDMRIMRNIVVKNGHLLDDRVGLGFKAYLMRERGVNESPVNFYGSFYLWNDLGAMAQFLVGGGAFERIICVAGPARAFVPKAASRHLTPLSEDLDCAADGLGLARRIQEECDLLHGVRSCEGIHTAALALDPHNWQLMRFIAWKDSVPQEEKALERYEVLHVSTPELSNLPNGRVW
jgi:hypothetical protein